MNLTPEERAIRDYYLAKPKLGSSAATFEAILLIGALAVFGYGFFSSGDGRPMIFTGFCLCLIAAFRYVYYGIIYRPHITSLLRKYEDAINEKTDE